MLSKWLCVFFCISSMESWGNCGKKSTNVVNKVLANVSCLDQCLTWKHIFIVLISAFRKKSVDFILARQPSIWTTLCSRKHGGDGQRVWHLAEAWPSWERLQRDSLNFWDRKNMIDVHLASLKAWMKASQMGIYEVKVNAEHSPSSTAGVSHFERRKR